MNRIPETDSSKPSSARVGGAESVQTSDGSVAVWSFLADLVSRGAAGVLTVVAHEGVVSVALRSGWMVGVRPEHESEDVGLGDHLVRSGSISRQRCEELLEVRAAADQPLREILLERQVLHREVIESARREWAHELFREALLWEGAELTFHPDHETDRIRELDPTPLANLLLVESDRLERRLPTPADLPGPATSFRRAGSSLEAEAVGHSLDESRVLSAFESEASVLQVAEATGLSPATVRLIAWRLDRSGFLEQMAEPDEDEAAAAPPVEATGPTGASLPGDEEGAVSVRRSLEVAGRWVPVGCVVASLIALSIGLAVAPQRLALPLPSQDQAREDWQEAVSATAGSTLESAATVFALVEGRAPESPRALVRGGLTSSRTPVAARHLQAPVPSLGVTMGSDAQNFLLQSPPPPEELPEPAPLVLLGDGGAPTS